MIDHRPLRSGSVVRGAGQEGRGHPGCEHSGTQGPGGFLLISSLASHPCISNSYKHKVSVPLSRAGDQGLGDHQGRGGDHPPLQQEAPGQTAQVEHS